MKDILLLEKLYNEQTELPDEIAGYKVIVKDGMRVIEGTVDISSRGLTELPDFSSVDLVENYFQCYNNELASLKGCPKAVGVAFHCHFNKLTSLEGCPQSVGGDFVCHNNNLTTLDGAPRRIGLSFTCDENPLTTLNGGPISVGGSFSCGKSNITTLEGCPRSIGYGLFCKHCKLVSLKGCPQNIPYVFFCNNNKLTSLEWGPISVGSNFGCNDNPLTSLKGFPAKTGESCLIGENIFGLPSGPTDWFKVKDLSPNIPDILDDLKALTIYKDIHVPLSDQIFKKYILPDKYKIYWGIIESDLPLSDKDGLIKYLKLGFIKKYTAPIETLDL